MNLFYTADGNVIHEHFILAAYLVFVVVMAWDWLAPRLQVAAALRAARQLARRRASRTGQGNTTP